MPAWFRGQDMKLHRSIALMRPPSGSQCRCSGGGQVELVETVDGLTAAQVAGQAPAKDPPVERIVTATF
ncbi:MAG: hypothetical protein H6918_13060 [Sphingomonadaceae bacterium]|nr:hypothetical protein [Sphingomonadaceae bacterium]